MKLFLASFESVPVFLREDSKNVKYVLESFYYIKPWQIPYIQHYWKEVLIDSGAFTFMNNCKGNVNFETYTDKYIKFINENDIKYFFELDVDSIVGYQEVLRLRKKLENGTQKKCIPVWHKSRGKDEFKRMCNEYDYVALGGLAIKEINRSEYEYLHWFTNYAHQHNCKIHGLGFTGQDAVKYGFDSVDSTSWKSAPRFGTLSMFTGTCIKNYKKDGCRLVGGNHTAIRHNLYEWIKYQKYLDNLSVYDKTIMR